MEAHALNPSAGSALAGRSPLLRLQSDEKLIALIRRGHHGAFDALFQRYQSRLLAFCRHMLGSTEDAEDVLQEVFTAAFNAMLADDRPINARPWLYRIARNRCLNHLRRPVAAGLDSMDVFERDGGVTTADTVHRREEFRQIVSDVQDLPETQRTALLLREIDALSYDQIAEAMDTTVPSVKSLLVRARVSLAEAAEARLLTCAEVRVELGEVAEGLTRTSPPVRRHLKHCERCRLFRSELRNANRALAAVYPVGLLVVFKKLVLAKLGSGAAGGGIAAGGAGAGATGAGAAGAGAAAMTSAAGSVVGAAGTAAGAAGTAAIGGGAAAAGGAVAGSALSAGMGAVASKAVAGLAAVTIVTAGAVEVKKVAQRDRAVVTATPAVAAPEPATEVAAETAPAVPAPATELAVDEPVQPEPAPAPVVPVETPAVEPAPVPEPEPTTPPAPAAGIVDEGSSTTTLTPRAEEEQPTTDSEEEPPPPPEEESDVQQSQPSTPPGEARSTPEDRQPAPVAGEPAPRSGE
jgi:RNA polymerase sigma factor (sigma-70 family)